MNLDQRFNKKLPVLATFIVGLALFGISRCTPQDEKPLYTQTNNYYYMNGKHETEFALKNNQNRIFQGSGKVIVSGNGELYNLEMVEGEGTVDKEKGTFKFTVGAYETIKVLSGSSTVSNIVPITFTFISVEPIEPPESKPASNIPVTP